MRVHHKEEILMVSSSFPINGGPYTISPGAKVTIITDGSNKTISRGSYLGAFITVNGDLNLGKTGSGGGKLILDGSTNGNALNAILEVAGNLTMEDGVLLTGNLNGNSSLRGGAVYLTGTFTMNGGEISGNSDSPPMGTNAQGGGVFVNGGSFTMNGGEIKDNSVTNISSDLVYGGGVSGSGGTLIPTSLSGGYVTCNFAPAGTPNDVVP